MDSNGSITEKLVGSIELLPPMPSNILKIRRAVSDPNMNYTHLVPILKEDPSICADLLRIANSARYGIGHNVDTVDEAVRYFGMHSLVDFISAACSEKIVKQYFSSIGNLNEYLRHSRQISFAVSFICKMLKLSAHDQEVLSVTSLLHDIGRLVITLVTNKQHYSRELFGVSWEDIHKFVLDENELYGIDHAILGMKICSKWQFPDKITRGVRRHHTPLLENDFCFEGFIIFLAELIAVENLPDNVLMKTVPDEIMRKFGIDNSLLIETRSKYHQALLS
ncbi:MAG: hypothetical protein A2017_00750 [Lentisphaerae bacterium GWF2_44_16]|nr:MAG: hypothetical protein A2017_00750 [Lentisphaerae bacterium GWF2_44_16]